MKIGSLFSGIGGFDLAARWMGWETAWFAEIDPHCSKILTRHWPEVPNHGDVTQIDYATVEAVDGLCGGFPCQPASTAGQRRGVADHRWLWPECARAIRALEPRWCVFENVAGLLSVNRGRGFGSVLRDLADLGYDVQWHRLAAAHVGAPHRRDRIWICAHAQRVQQSREEPCHGTVGRVGREQQPVAWDRPWESALCEFRGMDDGLSYGVDRLDGCRNAIVPQVAYAIFQAMEQAGII